MDSLWLFEKLSEICWRAMKAVKLQADDARDRGRAVTQK